MFLTEEVSFVTIANFIVALSIVGSAFLAVFYIIKGGIMAITSGGDQEKLKKAMHAIRYSIVGFVVVILAIFIVKIIGAVFNINFLSYLTWNHMTEMFEVIMQRLQGNYPAPAPTPF